MANLNKKYCDCVGFYNEAENTCEPLQPNDPNPCPSTFWGNLWSWVGTNVHIGGGGGYSPNVFGGNDDNGYEKENYTTYYIIGGIILVALIWYMTKGNKGK